MSTEEKSIQQDIMDRVYGIWQKHKDWTKEDFWNHLNYQERVAVSLGNFNYQVCNGGFSQWEFNGYYEQHHSFLVSLLSGISSDKFPLLSKVSKMLVECKPIFKEINTIRDDDYDDEEEREECLEEAEVQLDNLDDLYYKIDEGDILKEMEALIIEAGKED